MAEEIYQERVQVNPGGLSDGPSSTDTAGFTPYVRALAWFLLSEKTLPPLTVSIEGPWGSGKSSFMLQLEKFIDSTARARKRRPTTAARHDNTGDIYFIRFNAWRNDKDEALWAAFAITLMKQLAQRIPFWRRLSSNLQLLWGRIDWSAVRLQLALTVLFALAIIILTSVFLKYPFLIDPKQQPAATGVLGVAWLGTAWLAYRKAKEIFGNPLSTDLGKFVGNPRYEDKLAVIERFQRDFATIVQTYLGRGGRVYIFIDDLDRCEVPRAADLMQAINLLMSAELANMYFILGIDREMVAAGLAAKHQKILPYLAASSARLNEKAQTARVGIEYGYSFLEKFIQVSFRVPVMQEGQIDKLVTNLLQSTVVSPKPEIENDDPETARFALVAGSDPEGFAGIVIHIAKVFDFNPRRLKQFVNLFRLRVMIGLSTDVLALSGRTLTGNGQRNISLPQLGIFTAITLRWPQLTGDLVVDPRLLHRLIVNEPIESKWAANRDLRAALIDFGPAYSLRDVDLTPLLLVMPDTYGRGLGDFQEDERANERPSPSDSSSHDSSSFDEESETSPESERTAA
jgi:KAP family P-loop domain